ncbi:hypothetical protein Tco_1030702 [Tanacetum coccineum]|uniref:Tf2-1-like SH3-like domain-containing protein n=1 Tax=Tanacetum coccineum TaxID=301880 RepID=A0ABQ5G6Z0_9ASTR
MTTQKLVAKPSTLPSAFVSCDAEILLRNSWEQFALGMITSQQSLDFGDYVQGNITICHVYYVDNLGHNLFLVGQLCDGDLEVAFGWTIMVGKRGKLNPRFVGPFKVIKRVGDVAYKLELPEELSRVHNTFHVSNLKKCHADEPLAVPLDGLHFDDKLQFVEEPIEITDREVKRLKRSRIPLVKVRWNSKRGPEFTWEREDQFRKKYPHLFLKTGPSSSAAS